MVRFQRLDTVSNISRDEIQCQTSTAIRYNAKHATLQNFHVRHNTNLHFPRPSRWCRRLQIFRSAAPFFADNGHKCSLLMRELNLGPAAFYNLARYRTFKTVGEEMGDW